MHCHSFPHNKIAPFITAFPIVVQFEGGSRNAKCKENVFGDGNDNIAGSKDASKQASHLEDCHGYETKNIGKDKLLIDRQVEPGVI